jgi:hypothetical protein
VDPAAVPVQVEQESAAADLVPVGQVAAALEAWVEEEEQAEPRVKGAPRENGRRR